MSDLDDFSSYDLGRLLEALRAGVVENERQYPGPLLRRSFIQLVTWDHRWRTCWDDPTFLARYNWLREQLNIDQTPALHSVVARLAPLVDQLVERDRINSDDEPF